MNFVKKTYKMNSTKSTNLLGTYYNLNFSCGRNFFIGFQKCKMVCVVY